MMAKSLFVSLLLGVLLAPIFAEESMSVMKKGKDGKESHHTLLIDEAKGLAIEHVGEGRKSVTLVIDYKTGVIAYRMFDSQSCVLVRMNKATFPSLDKLKQILQEQKSGKQSAPAPPRQYTVTPAHIKDLSGLGAPVNTLCRDLTVNWAQEQIGNMLYGDAGACLNINLLFLIDVNLCGHIGVW
ncbi:gastrokine-1-like [Amia ocellicauda]|uniref:gastrokine-1-like n=1 Tax=Amia ocellicauda TaxID=2972642 RepID=UPI0034639EB1